MCVLPRKKKYRTKLPPTNATKDKEPHLITIQPPPQIPRPPHQLLILMLLHLQLPLPLNTNGPHSGILLASAVQEPVIALLPDIHALAEIRGRAVRVLDVGRRGELGFFDVGDQGGGVRHVGYFAGGVGGLGDCEDRFVGAVLGVAVWCGFGREHLLVGHGLWRGWGIKGPVVTREDVLREWDLGVRRALVEMSDFAFCVVGFCCDGDSKFVCFGVPAFLLRC